MPEQWLAPISDLLRDLEQKAATATPEERVRLLEQAITRLPELLGNMDVDGLAQVIERGLGNAVLTGARMSVAVANRRTQTKPRTRRIEITRNERGHMIGARVEEA